MGTPPNSWKANLLVKVRVWVLSISHDIIVQGHQGEIRVETEVGSFAEFILILPR